MGENITRWVRVNEMKNIFVDLKSTFFIFPRFSNNFWSPFPLYEDKYWTTPCFIYLFVIVWQKSRASVGLNVCQSYNLTQKSKFWPACWSAQHQIPGQDMQATLKNKIKLPIECHNIPFFSPFFFIDIKIWKTNVWNCLCC